MKQQERDLMQAIAYWTVRKIVHELDTSPRADEATTTEVAVLVGSLCARWLKDHGHEDADKVLRVKLESKEMVHN
mgnify:CR=1 FL=1